MLEWRKIQEAAETVSEDMQPPPPPPPAEIRPVSQADDTVTACLVAEAGGEADPIRGMTAVMNVIQNRARKGGWYGKTFHAVATKPAQFSCFRSGVAGTVAAAKKHPHWLLAQRIVQAAEQGKLPDITGGAVSYYAHRGANGIKAPGWAARLVHTVDIQNHRFYKEK